MIVIINSFYDEYLPVGMKPVVVIINSFYDECLPLGMKSVVVIIVKISTFDFMYVCRPTYGIICMARLFVLKLLCDM